jgi:hypothetical protein
MVAPLIKVIDFKSQDDNNDTINIYVEKDKPERLFKVIISLGGRILESGDWLDEEETKEYVKKVIDKWNWEINKPYWKLGLGETIIYDIWEIEC